MITITRQAARRVRAILRRFTLGISHRASIPPVVLCAEGAQLRAQSRYGHLAVEHVESGSFAPVMSIAIPLDALGDFEGRDDSPVVIEAVTPQRTVVRWNDRGIPQTREYDVTPLDALDAFPEPPRSWAPSSPALLDALAEATRMGDVDSKRYALDCVQLRGTVHKVIATDGRQLYVRSRLALPWDGDLLIKGAPIFGSKSLPRDLPVHIGRTDSHVILRIGPWTIWNEIQKDVRFPRVEDAIPDSDAVTTRLQLDPDDASFLASALDRLPGNDETFCPATLDMNGKVAVRACEPEQPLATELVLSRSRYSGPAVRFNTDRTYLRRAIRMGFRELEIAGAGLPIVCRHDQLLYAWQPLNSESAIEPTDNVVRIQSSPDASALAAQETKQPAPRSIMNERAQRNGHEPRVTAGNSEQPASEPTGTSLTTLIKDAEALHATLTEAKSSLARLISGLRRQRKQSRLLSETLRSLKQLKLTEVAE